MTACQHLHRSKLLAQRRGSQTAGIRNNQTRTRLLGGVVGGRSILPPPRLGAIGL